MPRGRVGLLLKKHFLKRQGGKVTADGGKRRDTFPTKQEERGERGVGADKPIDFTWGLKGLPMLLFSL